MERAQVIHPSSTNADPVDTTSNPVRCAIYQYDLDGSNGKIFARGIRNAEGLAFVPSTNELWAAVNEMDDILYPWIQTFPKPGIAVLKATRFGGTVSSRHPWAQVFRMGATPPNMETDVHKRKECKREDRN